MSSIPPVGGKGGASLVSVAKLVMESAIKAGVPIDSKAAHSYAKKLGKLQTQSKKKGGSLGQVHYSVSKFMASHGKNQTAATSAAAASAVSASSTTQNTINVTEAPDLQIPSLSTSAAAALRPTAAGVTLGQLRPLKSMIEGEDQQSSLKSQEAAAATAVAHANPSSPAKLKPKVSLRRLVSAAYMPHHLRPALSQQELQEETSSSVGQTAKPSSSSETVVGESESTTAVKDALGLGLDLTPIKKPETRLSESVRPLKAKTMVSSSIVFPTYGGVTETVSGKKRGSEPSSQREMSPKDATISLSEFISRHVTAPAEAAAAADHDATSLHSKDDKKGKRSPSSEKEMADAILAENPSAVDLGVALAPPPKKRTTLGSLSATLSAAAAARQKLLEERRLEQLRQQQEGKEKKESAPSATQTMTTTEKDMKAATAAPSPPLGKSPTLGLGLGLESLSSGFKLTEDDSPLFGDENEIALRKGREERQEKEAALAKEAKMQQQAFSTAAASMMSYTIPTAAPSKVPPVTPISAEASSTQDTTPSTFAIRKDYTEMVGAAPKMAESVVSSASASTTSAEEWEAQRAKEMESLRKAQEEEEIRKKNAEIEREHAALGEAWVAKQHELAQKVLRDVSTGALRPKAALTSDFYHKYREELFFLRDTEAIAKCVSIDPTTGDAIDKDGNSIPTKPDWQVALEVFERAAASATLTNPLPADMHKMYLRKMSRAPLDKRVAALRHFREAAVSNKALAPQALILELGQLAKSPTEKARELFLEKFKSIPLDRRMQLPRTIHMKAIRAELISGDPAKSWVKALSDIDAYTKVHGPQQGVMERAVLKAYARISKNAYPTVTKDVRRHIVDVMTARFEAMKKEPKSRGGLYDDAESVIVTSNVNPRDASQTESAPPAEPSADGSSSAPSSSPSVLTFKVPVAIGGGAGGESRNKLYLALALRGGAARAALQQAVQASHSESNMTANDEFAYSLLIRRSQQEEIPELIRQIDQKGLDLHATSILCVRMSVSQSAEEANQLIEEAMLAKRESFVPSAPIVRSACAALRAADYEHVGLLERLIQWQTTHNHKFELHTRRAVLLGKVRCGRYKEAASDVILGVIRTMELSIASGEPLDPSDPSKIATPELIAKLRDPNRDPLSLDGIILNSTTCGAFRRRVLNTCFIHLGRKPITENEELTFQTAEERRAIIEEVRNSARSSSSAPVPIRSLFHFGIASASGVPKADAGSRDDTAASASAAEVDMPYTDILLQHAKDRNWAAAVALMPQFPTTVPPQQVSALTLVYNCVLSSAVERPDVVENVLTEMKRTNAVPNATTFNTVMSSYARSDDKWKDALDIFNTMPASVKDASSYSVALSILGKQDMAEEAMTVFTEVQKAIAKPSPILYGLAIQAVQKHSWENTFTIFKALVKAHGPEAGRKESILSRVKKALETENRTTELAEVEKILAAPQAGGKKQKGNKEKGDGKKNKQSEQPRPQQAETQHTPASSSSKPQSQPQQQQQSQSQNQQATSPISIADDDF